MSLPRLAGLREPGLRRAGAQSSSGGGGGAGGGSGNAVDVAVQDLGGLYASDNVEDALQENQTDQNALRALVALRPLTTDLASRATGKGAALVGVEDAGNYFPGILAGGGTMNVETVIANLAIASNDMDTYASTNFGLRPLTSDLAATTAALGASLIGIEDAGGLITATTVEGALAEIATAAGAGLIPLTRGGTGQITAAGAFDALTVTAPALTSAATVDLSLAGCPGHYAVVNGATGPITSFGTAPAGTERVLRFASTPTITHNAVSLILPGAASIVVAAGDVLFLHSLGSGNWRATNYMRAASLAAYANDLAAVTAGKGASTIGIQDALAIITATTVEAALAELATSVGTNTTAIGLRPLTTDLAAVTAGKGASLIGIQDALAIITATTVEAALAELATSIGTNTTAIGLRPLSTDLASTAAGKGASLIGIQDAAAIITATTAEGALAELATSIAGHTTQLAGAFTPTGKYTITPTTPAGNRTASTEYVGADFNQGRTVTWATGAIATQREALFRKPVYASVGASVMTTAATLTVTGAPTTTGGQLTITRPLAFWAQADDAFFAGRIGLSTGQKIGFTDTSILADTNWQMGQESTPTGAQLVTAGAVVFSLYGTSPGYGWMLRNIAGTSLMEVHASDGASRFGGPITVALADASTNTQPDVLALGHASSGTAAAAFGATVGFDLQSTTGVKRRSVEIVGKLATATNLAEVGSLTFRMISAGTMATDFYVFTPSTATFAVPTLAVNGGGSKISFGNTGDCTVGRNAGTGATEIGGTTAGITALQRFSEKRGTDTATATTLTLPLNGNFFHLTGTTTVSYLTTTNWQDGARIELYFVAAATVTHNTASVPGGTVAFQLVGAVDYAVPAGGKLTLRYDAGLAKALEVGRSAA